MAPWLVSGTYLEACNCDPICPCRRIDGTAGGRSTHGVCMGALSWRIEAGNYGALDLGGLAAVLACRYSDDEPGSPWTFALYVDERGDSEQRSALGEIFTGRAGGSALAHFPWAWKESEEVAVRPAAIEVDHTPGRGWFRAGGSVEVRVRAPYAGEETVSCVIPGHEREGREVVTERLRVAAERALEFDFQRVCGYESSFEYGSEL